MSHGDHQIWTLTQSDAPELVWDLLDKAVEKAGPDVDLVEVDSTEDDFCYAVEYHSEDGLRRLLIALLGSTDGPRTLEHVGTVADLADESRRAPAMAAARREGSAEISIVRDGTSWSLIAEVAADVGPNNASWPVPIAIAQYVAAALERTDVQDELN